MSVMAAEALAVAQDKAVREDLNFEARRIRARHELDRIEQLRLVARAIAENVPQVDIGKMLDLSQPTISRMARQVRNPYANATAVTPWEVILRRVVREIDAGQMHDWLLRLGLTLGKSDPSGGDGYIAGSFDEIQEAVGRGFLSDEEYRDLVREVVGHDGAAISVVEESSVLVSLVADEPAVATRGRERRGRTGADHEPADAADPRE